MFESDFICFTTVIGKTKSKDEDESQPIKWKWSQVKQSGCRPSPRCGMSLATISGNKGFVYGGVFDQVI